MPVDPCFDDLLSDPRNTVRPPPAHVPLARVRAAADAAMAQGDAPAMASVRDDAMPCGTHHVPVRHYRPTDAAALPAILFCHGGGFVWGSIETHDGLCRRLAAATGAAVASVGYRLAPETPFPGPVEDARAALRHLAGADGIDGGALALCGDSAGAAICASLAKLAPRDGIALRHLALLYPALDPACDTPSQHALADGPLLTRDAMRWFWSAYLGDAEPGDDRLPLHPAGLEHLPPTIIATAEFDPLRDEGAALAERLRALGTDVVLRCVPGMVHGFLSLPAASPVADAAMHEVHARLRTALAGRS
ncbi:alpha/beta hydrolase [Jannaschia sp. W003]|uniref:alpha/beta hydrolase n=1 Tax=Jannaschia sp. W003 TaxID=2867012 RepID=UPI0021A32DE8|nr:alpha/beta hydrolase [Jannaschia sp. W003]UWQ21800.1 alpha/beta hydrolase [Jannaschia sp. W003]